ncbi:MAG: PriCT-2 domain-containing protein [Pseudomonadota bacterium]
MGRKYSREAGTAQQSVSELIYRRNPQSKENPQSVDQACTPQSPNRKKKPKKRQRQKSGLKKRNEAFDQVAHQLLANGYGVTPTSGKRPQWSGWIERFCENILAECPERIEAYVKTYGVGYRGVRLDGVAAPVRDGLIILDIDCTPQEEPALWRELQRIVPQAFSMTTPACIGRPGRLKAFMRLNCEQTELELKALKVPGSMTGNTVELLTHHALAVIPPTLHSEEVGPYHWRDAKHTLLTTAFDDLPIITLDEIAAIRERVVQKKVSRRDAAKALKKLSKASEVGKRLEAQKRADQTRIVRQNRWDGDLVELHRLAAALSFISSDDEGEWWRVGRALKRYSGGRSELFDLWCAWAGGGLYVGTRFVGSPKFNATRRQEVEWERFEASEGPTITIATIIHEAGKAGFDKSLKGWPTLASKLSDKKSRQKTIKVDGPISAAANAMPNDLKLFFQARDALRWFASQDNRLTRAAVRLLNAIIDKVSHVEGGYAWPGRPNLASKAGVNIKTVRNLLSEQLRPLGYVISAPDAPHPDGQGVVYAITPPVEMKWSELIYRHRGQALDHKCVGPEEFETIGQARAESASKNKPPKSVPGKYGFTPSSIDSVPDQEGVTCDTLFPQGRH